MRGLVKDSPPAGGGGASCSCALRGKPMPHALPPLALGEHTEQVLRAAGFSGEEIAELRAEAEGVV